MNFYLHIPFCRQKCPYCKFALTPIFDEAKKKRYIAHLKSEIKSSLRNELDRRSRDGELVYGNGAEKPILRFALGAQHLLSQGGPDTLYFGGGTPSVLTLEEVADIVSCFEKGEATEVSFECNPEDITSEYVSGLFQLGITRLSIGIQSLNDDTLKAIHRSDRASISHALDAIDTTLCTLTLHSALSINIDFILGLPYSRPGETLENIRELHDRFPFITHTSVYMLEEGLYPKEWSDTSISESDIEQEYADICAYFDTLGWTHYEISNWSKPGYECQHNQGYWNHTNSRGFGLSATSYEGGKRWENSHSFSGYYRGDKMQEELLTVEQIELEKIIFDIRTFSLSEGDFSKTKIEELLAKKYITRKDGKILLTPTGIFRENTIISELI